MEQQQTIKNYNHLNDKRLFDKQSRYLYHLRTVHNLLGYSERITLNILHGPEAHRMKHLAIRLDSHLEPTYVMASIRN